MTLDDDTEFTFGDMQTWCTRCGRQIEPGPECSNLRCQQAAAAEPQAHGYVVQVDSEAGTMTVSGRASEPARREQTADAGSDAQGSGASPERERENGLHPHGVLGVMAALGHQGAAAVLNPRLPEPQRHGGRGWKHAIPARARDAKPVPKRRLWRGVSGGQSVIVLQWMGAMWSQWESWGDVT